MVRTQQIGFAALAAFLLLAPARAEARPIALAWDANPEPAVTGYILSYGTQPGVYTTSVDVGNLIAYQIDLPGAQYYFAIRAYTATGATSPLSAEVAESSVIALTNPGDQSDAPLFTVSVPLAATGSPTAYSATNLPGGLSINSSGLITGTISAGAGASSPYVVKAVASNAAGNASSVQFKWTIVVNHAPTLTNPGSQSSAQSATVSLQLAASDVDGDSLSYSATGLPPSLTVNPATGLISGTLSAASAGVYSVTATVSDSILSNSQTFTWTVTGTNQPPTLTAPANQTSAENATVSLQLVATDPNGNTLTYSATGLPPLLTVNAATGLISGTLTFTSAGVYSVTATASDGSLSSSKTFTWTVTNVNRPPTITAPATQTSAENATVSLQVVASDPDGGTLTYSAVGLPTGLSVNAVSGLIGGTVAPGSAGTYSPTVTVSDGVLTANASFTWNVFAPGALTVDKVVSADITGATVTTPSFSTTTAGETLVAFVSAAGPAVAQPVTITGAGLTWSLVRRANTQSGTAEVWKAVAAGLLSNVTVTSTEASGTFSQSLTVVTFTGAAGVGASAGASAASGAPSVLVTTTQPGSFVYAVGNDWDGSVARTLGANQAIVHQNMPSTGDTFWVQKMNAPVPAAGSQVQLNDTAPTTDQWNFAAVEVMAAATKTTPTITWAAPASITFGTPLSGTQLNATASVAGTFVYSPAAGTVLSAGAGQTLSVTFTPTNTASFTTATANVPITVVRATPTITWAAPAGITLGTPLGGTQLNATASVPGTFVYTPPAGTVLPVGASQSLSVTFTPTDAVDFTTATGATSITVTAPLPVTLAVTANLAAPQPAGTSITLTAAATGGMAPYQFKWWVSSAAGWTVLQDWNAAASYTWTPATANPQAMVEVWVRSAGNPANAPEKWADLPFAILQTLAVTANLAAPQTPGTSIVLTAAGASGTAPFQFKWWVLDPTTGWSVLQNWSTAATYTWTPTGLNPQAVVEVWTRSAGNVTDAPEKWADLPFAILPPLAVTANLPAPQSPGANITLTAAAAGGTAPYQFKWWVFSASGWTVLQDWNAAANYTWTPTAANPQGTIEVWMRSAGNAVDAPEKWVDLPFAILPTAITTLTATTNLPSPQPAGTTIMLTAVATGGTAPYQFKWWGFSAGGWTVLQDWNGSASYAWTPTSANPQGTVEVWVRSAGNSANAPEKWVDVPFVIQ